MWRSLFLAIGLFMVVLGVGFLCVDRVELRIHEQLPPSTILVDPAPHRGPPQGDRSGPLVAVELSVRGSGGLSLFLHDPAARAREMSNRSRALSRFSCSENGTVPSGPSAAARCYPAGLRPFELRQFRLGGGHLVLNGLQFPRIVHLLLRPGQLLAKRLEPQIERVDSLLCFLVHHGRPLMTPLALWERGWG